MRVTDNGYAYLADMVCDIADNTCDGKVVFVLEGGYDLGALRRSIKAVLETMCNGINENIKNKIEGSSKLHPSTAAIIQNVTNTHRPFWRCFSNV